MKLVNENVMVEWVELGEGLDGDYNPEDPTDIELLRFDVSILIDGEWVEKEGASYCTQFPAYATEKQKMKGLQLLLDQFHDVLSSDTDVSVKKLGERMSWISLESIYDIKKLTSLLNKNQNLVDVKHTGFNADFPTFQVTLYDGVQESWEIRDDNEVYYYDHNEDEWKHTHRLPA
ncbi:hypothetical protein QTG56_24215 (plasmid) [Rossellomorea sp. AcN35-11]|nr:hypothetical protein [Rossellomorea aquimaris]WJV31745.1 hypothetical protein QTG56_24215 [Rossellomorea sp. AcN35-11]